SPSCQTSESSVTAPSAALRRSSVMRIGPTGTPLIAQYHSSALESSSSSIAAAASSPSFCTDDLNAPASAPPAGGCGARGAAGRAAERLVARPPGRAAPGRGAAGAVDGRVAGLGAPGAGGESDCGNADETLVSVTAARTSIWCPHLRHFIRTVLPATFSSE